MSGQIVPILVDRGSERSFYRVRYAHGQANRLWSCNVVADERRARVRILPLNRQN